MSRGNIAYIGIAVLIVLGGLFALTSAGLLSIGVLGEEGYHPYDVLLQGGTLDTSLWVPTGFSSSCYGVECEAALRAYKENNYVTITTAPNELTINGNRWFDYDLRTRDLRLVDFRAELVLGSAGPDTYTTCVYNVCHTASGNRRGRTAPIQVPLVLLWDDYEEGHYQLFMNGEIVREGFVPEGMPFYLSFPARASSFASGYITIKNPRVKELFRCDLQEGEVVQDACFGGPSVVQLSDLPGFEVDRQVQGRFCTDFPAQKIDAGVAKASKQVYYALARGEPVVLQDEQAWKFQYIRRAPEAEDLVGFGPGCTEPVLVEDEIDLVTTPPVISGATLKWTSAARYELGEYKRQETQLMSGDQVFMDVKGPTISEAEECDYLDNVERRFPGDVPRYCITLQAFGQPFTEGDKIVITEGLTVQLEGLVIEYEIDEGRKRYSYRANWRLDFSDDAVRIRTYTVPRELGLGSLDQTSVTIASTLPGPGSFTLLREQTSTIVGESTSDARAFTLPTRGTATLKLSTQSDIYGETRVLAYPIMQFPGGNIAFEGVQTEYNVVVTPGDTTSAPVDEASAPTGIFARFWAWIKNLFGGGN